MTFRDHIDKFISMEEDQEGKRVLNDEQSAVFKDILKNYKRGGTAFLQGEGGSGKTVTIMALKKFCDANGISCALTASTGKAGSAIGGVTIHSFINLSMKENNYADKVEDAFVLDRKDDYTIDIPDILVIDEASMIGHRLLKEIMKTGFPYILFVGDVHQLAPVKDKVVDWRSFVGQYYQLFKVMRTKVPELIEIFSDFRKQKEGLIENIRIEDYINGKNIVRVDYQDIDKMPINTECTFVGYRNKLVEQLANKLTDEKHNMYNLNVGVTITVMKVNEKRPKKNPAGYFEREFVTVQKFFNGEDVQIIPIEGVTQELIAKGYTTYGKWRLKLSKNGILITNTKAKVMYGDVESMEDKYFISFPQDEVLEYCTLSVVGGDTFALVWDGSEDEFKGMIDFYFGELYPYLRKFQVVQQHFKGKHPDLSYLGIDVKNKILKLGQTEFMDWYADHDDSFLRKRGWKHLLNAKKVVSARPTTARTIHKAQGVSVPAILVSKDSFYGASKDAQYVAITRPKHGIIFVDNVPENWKRKDLEQ